MIRFAIADDEPLFQKQLKEYLTRYGTESDQAFSIAVYDDGAALLEAYRGQYDILLLDIQMKDMDGMTAAKRIRAIDEEIVIVFITNMQQYAIEGYSVGALDYLLKPVTYYAFSQCMERVIRRIKRKDKTYLLVNSPQGGRKIDADELLHVEIHSHLLIYHTKSGDISAIGSMKEVEDSLSGLPFYRCNKGDLINLAHVDGIRDGDAVVGGKTVPVSRAKKKAFLDALNRYINEARA